MASWVMTRRTFEHGGATTKLGAIDFITPQPPPLFVSDWLDVLVKKKTEEQEMKKHNRKEQNEGEKCRHAIIEKSKEGRETDNLKGG